MSSPVLMFVGEHAVVRWVDSLDSDRSFGWNVERVQRWQRKINVTYYPIAVLGGAAAVGALALALPVAHDVVPVPSGWGDVLQFYVFGQVGFTALGGLYGVFRWVAVSLASVAGTSLLWRPYRTQHNRCLKRAYQISVMIAVFFSCGALFVPTLVGVVGDLVPVARVIVWTFIGLLLGGGVLIFIIPIIALSAALARGKEKYLAGLDTPISDLIDEIVAWRPEDDRDDRSKPFDVIERMMSLREAVAGMRLVPLGPTFGRATLTTIIPVLSFGLSIVQSGFINF